MIIPSVSTWEEENVFARLVDNPSCQAKRITKQVVIVLYGIKMEMEIVYVLVDLA